MKNPYTHRSTVRDPQMFFGRTSVMNRLFALIANGQSVSVVGDRRIGKSSLLFAAGAPQVQERIPGYDFAHHRFLYVDLQGSIYREPDMLLAHLLRQLFPEADKGAGAGRSPVSPYAFEEAIAQANRQGVTVVFLLDEFDCVTRNEQLNLPFFSFLRYMATNYELSLVVVSHTRLGDLCRTEIVDSPFFNIFAMIHLAGLQEDAARELIRVPSERAGFSLAPYDDWILDLAGSHPFFLQMLCFYLLEASRRGQPIDMAWAESRFRQEAADHFTYAWEHADAAGREAMAWAAWQPHGEYDRSLNSSRAFREFVRERSGMAGETAVRIKDVEAALDHLWDMVWLARCPLARLPQVRKLGAQQQAIVTNADRGKALHHALLAAINALKGGREADKGDKRWRAWYILHHKYVERHSNRQIYMRLNLSERTFYRERREAIKGVMHVLCP